MNDLASVESLSTWLKIQGTSPEHLAHRQTIARQNEKRAIAGKQSARISASHPPHQTGDEHR